ncbi:MAG: hypothetical protein Q7U98_20235 [Methylicorpusculum sp.]|uniref:hypothetical protein n=1 Tax=Methylicorpusculum sp. TaxID=2713644 RepID=UPI0027286EBF|nr:hypothetical protein [Methylicorpusculum sp.]MDO8941494.1 hypothetical protein [Methylicorpusculum sp.]MDP2202274.1 hypothetical protein [Methylicorpusculum sp.]
MPKVFVRTQPKSGLKVRHRAGMGFTEIWKETEVDDATRAALEEDPYLEVSETPTVLVEVAATFQAEAPNTPITPESTAGEDSTQGDEAVQSGAGEESAESSDVDDGAVDAVEEAAVVDDGAVEVVEVDAVVDDQSVVESTEEPAKPAKKAKKAAE